MLWCFWKIFWKVFYALLCCTTCCTSLTLCWRFFVVFYVICEFILTVTWLWLYICSVTDSKPRSIWTSTCDLQSRQQCDDWITLWIKTVLFDFWLMLDSAWEKILVSQLDPQHLLTWRYAVEDWLSGTPGKIPDGVTVILAWHD